VRPALQEAINLVFTLVNVPSFESRLLQ